MRTRRGESRLQERFFVFVFFVCVVLLKATTKASGLFARAKIKRSSQSKGGRKEALRKGQRGMTELRLVRSFHLVCLGNALGP